MILYKVAVKVRPAVHHAFFWDVQGGYLIVWLFAQSVEEAAKLADGVAAALPYDYISSSFEVQLAEPAHRDDFAAKVAEAKQTGLSFLLIGWPPGAEETEDDSDERTA